MGVISLNSMLAAKKQKLNLSKYGVTISTSNGTFWSTLLSAGTPGPAASLLSIAGAANTGTMPTGASLPGSVGLIPANAGEVNELMSVNFSLSGAQVRVFLQDILWISPEISVTAAGTTNFSGQPSFLSRLVDDQDLRNVKLYYLCSSAFSGTVSPVVSCNYRDPSNTDVQSAQNTLSNTLQLRQSTFMPLAASASGPGFSRINSCTVHTPISGGTPNGKLVLMAVRDVWNACSTMSDGSTFITDNFDKTNMIKLHNDFCPHVMIQLLSSTAILPAYELSASIHTTAQ